MREQKMREQKMREQRMREPGRTNLEFSFIKDVDQLFRNKLVEARHECPELLRDPFRDSVLDKQTVSQDPPQYETQTNEQG
jgi:hypothetical protein